jgi:hypothetical protein
VSSLLQALLGFTIVAAPLGLLALIAKW